MQQQPPLLPPAAPVPRRSLSTANASDVRVAAAKPLAAGPVSTAPAAASVRATPASLVAPVRAHAPVAPAPAAPAPAAPAPAPPTPAAPAPVAPARAPAAAAPVRAAIVAAPVRDAPGVGALRPTAVMAARLHAAPTESTLQVPLETLVVVVLVLLVAVGVAVAMRLRRRTRRCDFLVRGNAMTIHEGEAPPDPIVEAQGDRPTGGWRRRVGPVTMLAGAGGEGRVTEGDDSSYSTTDAGDDWSGDADDEATGLEARGDAPPAGDGSESIMSPRSMGGQEEEGDDGEDSELEEAQLDYSTDYIDEQTIENFIMALITQQEKEKQCGTLPQESSSSA